MFLRICLIFMALSIFTNSYALSNKDYQEFMKRSDFNYADTYMNSAWKKMRSIIDKETFKKVLSLQRKWIKNGREKEVAYLIRTQPFYDEIRMYAISTMARAEWINQIYNFLNSSQSFTDKEFENFLKKINYISLLNYYSKKLEIENDYSIISNDYVHCSYRDNDSTKEILGAAADLLSYISSGSAQKASILASVLSNIDQQDITCQFRGNVKDYSSALFYQGLLSKYFTKEKHKINDSDYYNGFNISTTSIKSTLQYVTIRADAVENDNISKHLHVYGIDRDNKSLIDIDVNYFINNILKEYKEE